MAQQQDEQQKIFNDPVHGTMIFGPKLVEVIDTPQFQRLRNIKQLGTVYHVYPGATHSRFEHSLGTAHLAGKFIRMLRANQPELEINDDDILCVEMAGLCHDLGHGPYSHMFDQMFVPACGEKWKHEEGSCEMFSYLLRENNIRLSLSDKQHHEMVKKIRFMIKPQNMQKIPPPKRFLFEFISNERNKVDVDKWDYFARDCHHLGIRNSFDHERFMKLCRVNKLPNGDTTICAHIKESKNLYEMFHVRAALHKRAYQHRISTAVNLMLCDAMIKANDHIRIGNSKMSEVIRKMKEYTDFDDNILDRILQSTADGLQESKNILKRVKSRKFYQFVGLRKLNIDEFAKLEHKYKREILVHIADEVFHKMNSRPNKSNPENTIGVNVAKFDYGMKKENPCDNFYFYAKKNPSEPIKVKKRDVSEMLPEVFGEFEIQVFCKKESSEVASEVESAFKRWEHDCLGPILSVAEGQE